LDRIGFNLFGVMMLAMPLLIKWKVSSKTRSSELRREWLALLDRGSHLFFRGAALFHYLARDCPPEAWDGAASHMRKRRSSPSVVVTGGRVAVEASC
jgi:hypothetical protein